MWFNILKVDRFTNEGGYKGVYDGQTDEVLINLDNFNTVARGYDDMERVVEFSNVVTHELSHREYAKELGNNMNEVLKELDSVTKGRPLRGTYCPKHASHYMQLEMLQQQILADQHGLEFKAFKPRMPKMLKSGPITNLTKNDVASLTATGWLIRPPALGDNRTATEEVIRLITEINIMTDRLNHLMLSNSIQATNELPPQEEAIKEE